MAKKEKKQEEVIVKEPVFQEYISLNTHDRIAQLQKKGYRRVKLLPDGMLLMRKEITNG